MVANIQTIAFQGVEAVAVEVQVHLAPGQNAFNVVGLPDKSVGESRERVRAALTARGFNRILRVARSLADLAGRDGLTDKDIATALVWRGHS